MEFTKAFAKYAIIVAVVLGFALILLGIVILLFPDLFLQVLKYAVGGGALIIGVSLLGSLIRAKLKARKGSSQNT